MPGAIAGTGTATLPPNNFAALLFRLEELALVRLIQEGFKARFLQKHLNPIRGPFLGDSVRILGVCPAVTLTFGP